ncbi:MAG: DUF885 domain-containing protein [Bacteroidota bacterium]
MKRKLISSLALLFFIVGSCNNASEKKSSAANMKPISDFFEKYYNEHNRLFPMAATSNGDNRFNDLFPDDISEAYRDTLKHFYQSYLDSLNTYDESVLSENDQTSYEILKWDLEMAIDGYKFHDNLMPINQFWSATLTFPQYGSGQGNQPFKTVKDYDDFLKRIDGFAVWCSTAIDNMKKGMANGEVYPKILMERVLPQMKSMIVSDVKQSIFYMPVSDMPKDIAANDHQRLDNAYQNAIKTQIVPAYQKLHDFIKDEYIPKCRATAGISEIPNGKEYYNYLIKFWTTTNMTADEVFDLGQSEVNRLRTEMEKIKDEAGFKGNLKAYFTYLNKDKKFFPFNTAKEVLDSFENIHSKMQPQLNKLFDVVPKTKFEIRQTEKFREASASAEYNQGTADGTRPGIFYVPVPDPKKFNTFGMEDLFLHEAIPGHHYQISLQQENDSLPKFRRFTWYGAYGEGWALYTESLGKELGLYTDPVQYFGALSEEMHRAIRLVVDAGMHTKGWTREQAIKFSLENEGESEEAITSEIERYMAIPGQALSYKIGQLKIRELRAKAEKELGAKFNIAKFHDAVLDNGCLPLSVLEQKINIWIQSVK